LYLNLGGNRTSTKRSLASSSSIVDTSFTSLEVEQKRQVQTSFDLEKSIGGIRVAVAYAAKVSLDRVSVTVPDPSKYFLLLSTLSVPPSFYFPSSKISYEHHLVSSQEARDDEATIIHRVRPRNHHSRCGLAIAGTFATEDCSEQLTRKPCQERPR